MKERVCQFGPERNLTGILTEPAAKDVRPESPAVLMLNAGLIHRVGPHRMSFELAHRLAECGFRCLRFDLGGLGDSESLAEATSDENPALPDIKAAMDFLEVKHGIHSFVLFGLCSGADNSYAAAIHDPRISGMVLLDGFGFWTIKSYLVHYLPRVYRPQVWINLARRIFFPSRRSFEKDALLRQQQLRRPFGTRAEVESALQSLVDRGAQMLCFYTGGAEKYYNYAGQFFDTFKRLDGRGRIEVQFYPNADHTYTFSEDRDRMLTRVVEWVCSKKWNSTGNLKK
jgi:pimeloyl-ACP methyl ester carboxylesterase